VTVNTLNKSKPELKQESAYAQFVVALEGQVSFMGETYSYSLPHSGDET